MKKDLSNISLGEAVCKGAQDSLYISVRDVGYANTVARLIALHHTYPDSSMEELMCMLQVLSEYKTCVDHEEKN